MITNKELDDIIFKEREKSYGAYYLRRRYRRFVLFSFLMAILIVGIPLLILILPYLNNDRDSEWKSVTMEEFNRIDSLEFIPPPPLQEVELKKETKRFIVVDSVKQVAYKNRTTAIDSTQKASTDTTQFGNNEGEKKNNNTFYVLIEKMPEFPGGTDAFNQYITQNLNIEPYLKTKNLSGTVTISFSINKLGAVTDVRIINSLDSVVDRNVLNLFAHMPNWSPALSDGKPIKIQFVMPVNVSAQ